MESVMGTADQTMRTAGLAALIWVLMGWGGFFASGAAAEFYKYVDKDGNNVYVDEKGKIPPAYHDQIATYPEKVNPARQQSPGNHDEKRRLNEALRIQEQLDAQRYLRKLELERRQRKAQQQQEALAQQQETKVVIKGNHVLVPVNLGYAGKEIQTLLLLDTGASDIVLHRSLAQQLQIRGQQRAQVRTADGKKVWTALAQLSHMKTGPILVNAPTVVIIDYSGPPVEFKGLLGMSFLRHVNYSIDYQKQTIKWYPQTPP